MRRTIIAARALALLLCTGIAAHAAGTVLSKDAPDLTSIKAKVKAKDYAGALAEVKPLIETHENADVYNFYAFASRKTGDRKTAITYYAKALDYDPNHLGALEYQGEMFVEMGEMRKAQTNLAKLVTLCPSGCEEREDLEKAIKAAGTTKKK
jgi:tetratricopeptide (TPR) repeat protein